MLKINIVEPIAGVGVTGNLQELANVLTPAPKESAAALSDGSSVTIDLGAPALLDTIFVGYTNGAVGYQLGSRYGLGAADTPGPALPIAGSTRRAPLYRHAYNRAATPFSARYIQITNIPAGMTIGTIVVGLAFEPTFNNEMGSGRPITDTSVADRMFGGGFGIDRGAIASGYSWTFGDLQLADRDALFDIAMNVGTSRSLLVVEDPELTAGLNERLHWGLFQKLEPYERADPANWRWSLQIGDWA